MNPLDQFEYEQRLINELIDLFYFVPPRQLRRNIEDLVFSHLSQNDEQVIPNQKEVISHIYYLINFLNEVESIDSKD